MILEAKLFDFVASVKVRRLDAWPVELRFLNDFVEDFCVEM